MRMMALRTCWRGKCAPLHAGLPVPLQLGGYISDVASNVMLVEEHVLWMAQSEARACTRIVQCVERIADLALTTENQVISKVGLHSLTQTQTCKADFGFPDVMLDIDD